MLLSALMLVTVFTRPVIFQPLFFKTFYLSIPFFFYIVYIVLKNLRTHSSYATMNLIGIAIVFVAFFNDFAIAGDWYDSGRFMLPAVGIYVFMHFVFMSKGFAQSIQETEELNAQLFTLNTSLDRRVQERTAQLNKLNEDLKELTLTDGLTGIYNRHSFNEFMEKAFKKAQEKQLYLSVLMLDVDYFKKYNDHFGHVAGDELLKKLVKVVAIQLPQNSFFARYGGEEFVIVLPSMNYEEAYEIAESVRQAVAGARLDHPYSELDFVTYSIGVATMTKGEEFNSETELIDKADRKLYEAKQRGRNQIG